MYNAQLSREMSLADELGSSSSGLNSLLVLKCSHLWENDSPDSERLLTDADSGHSTAHSPTDGPKSMSPLLGMSPACMGGGTPYADVDMLEATHRGLHKFVPRHEDEIEVEIGDPIYVQKEADDLWCEGKFNYLLDVAIAVQHFSSAKFLNKVLTENIFDNLPAFNR